MPVHYLDPPEPLQSPTFSHAVVVEQPARTVYVGGQNGVDASGAVVRPPEPSTTFGSR